MDKVMKDIIQGKGLKPIQDDNQTHYYTVVTVRHNCQACHLYHICNEKPKGITVQCNRQFHKRK